MNVQKHLLTLAIASTLALAVAPADAAGALNRGAVARANTLLSGSAATLVRKARGDVLVAKDAIVDRNGTEHVRYHRTYGGLPMIGGDFVLHTRNGKVTGTSQTLKSSARPNLTPRINAGQAIVEAGAHFGSHFVGAPSSHLVVYALGSSPVLAHEVVFNGIKKDQTPTQMHYIVDATSGKILNKWDTIETARPRPGRGGGGSGVCAGGVAAVGTGKSLTVGNVTVDTAKCGTTYQMTDMTRGNGSTHNMANRTTGMGLVVTDGDNVWGNNLLTNSQTVAADAHYGIAMTWDYYKTEHGRNGIANDGKGAISRVHYGRNYGNAFWSDDCFCMTFGDGDNGASIFPLVAIDVAGHEMSHGVTSRTAALVYSGESGGLNEATSDIFGTMVEYYANNAADVPDYVLGDTLFPNNADKSQAIRWMFKPSLDGTSPDCYSAGLGNLDVHYSSGVANHFYYLLAEGAVVPSGFGAGTWANLTTTDLVCNGNTAITGIGREKAAKIWYAALTTQFTSGETYAAARAHTLAAATSLYGAASPEYNAVAAAWDAVSVTAAP